MSMPDGLLEVGKVGRAHGVHGDLFLDLTTDRTERVAVGARLWLRDGWYTIEQTHHASNRWRVHLAGVDGRNEAQALTGTLIYAEPIDDPDELWIHDLIGATVIDADGVERGRCVTVIDNPASDLLQLDSGALVPATFVTAIDTEADPTIVQIDPPEGLFELFEDG